MSMCTSMCTSRPSCTRAHTPHVTTTHAHHHTRAPPHTRTTSMSIRTTHPTHHLATHHPPNPPPVPPPSHPPPNPPPSHPTQPPLPSTSTAPPPHHPFASVPLPPTIMHARTHVTPWSPGAQRQGSTKVRAALPIASAALHSTCICSLRPRAVCRRLAAAECTGGCLQARPACTQPACTEPNCYAAAHVSVSHTVRGEEVSAALHDTPGSSSTMLSGALWQFGRSCLRRAAPRQARCLYTKDTSPGGNPARGFISFLPTAHDC